MITEKEFERLFREQFPDAHYSASGDERRFSDPHKPGRLDVNGEEWWACDPYPTWYRWENGKLSTNGPSGKWADDEIISVEDTENK